MSGKPRDVAWAKRSVGFGQDGGRDDRDFYETPIEATDALLSLETLASPVWEPAAGDGAITRRLRAHGLEVHETDIAFADPIDFLNTRHPAPVPFVDIVTNPPYRLAEDFVRTGYVHVLGSGGKLCLLLRLAFLEGLRDGLFQTLPLSRVHVFSRRLPRMHRVGWQGNRTSSMIAFAWFVWDTQAPMETRLDWVDWANLKVGG